MSKIDLSCVQGQAFVLGDHINTDLHCSGKYLPNQTDEAISRVAFDKLSPGFASKLAAVNGGILIAGDSFGINSSREQAVHIMQIMNIRGIIAKSFGRQFFRNAINNGIPVLECDTSALLEGEMLKIDFSTGKITSANHSILEALPLPKEMIQLIEFGGLIPFLKEHPDWKFS
jgi:3-isopropylmalate/(R)-2-methylmalate dehydratase small subunit